MPKSAQIGRWEIAAFFAVCWVVVIMPKIFVSYRRKSSEAITGRILDRMVTHYGKDSIFIDIDNIPAGVDFRQRINQVLNESDIMIAVVGPRWLGSGKQGRISIHRENDWVLLEVETALRRNALVIPVLVDGAQMPDASDLPESLKDFVYRNAVIVASGRDFHTHVNHLIQSIDSMVDADASKSAPQPVVEPSGSGAGGGRPPAPVKPETSETAHLVTGDQHSQPAAPEMVSGAVPAAQPIQVPLQAFLPQEAGEIIPSESARPEEILPPSTTPGAKRRKYSAAAAAMVTAAVLVAIVSYGALSYFLPAPHKIVLESAKDPTIVAAPDSAVAPKPIPPAVPPIRVAEVPRALVATLPPPPAAPTPPVVVAQTPPVQPLIQAEGSPPANLLTAESRAAGVTAGPPSGVMPTATVAAPPPPKPSCLTGVAQVSSSPLPLGGPFMPVKIQPNLVDAKEIRSIAVSPTGKEIATGTEDGLIRIWDTSSFKLVRTLRGHTEPVYALDYWIDGTLLVSASVDGTVRVWNPLDASTVQMFDTRLISGVSVKQYSGAFFPGRPLKYLASGGEDGIVHIWNIQSGMQESMRDQKSVAEPDRSTIRSLSYAPNGSGEFVTSGYDGKIRVYLITKHQVAVLDANARKTLRVSYSPDSSRIVTAGSDGPLPSQNSRALKIWTVSTQTSLPLLGHKDYVVSASWSPDGKRLITGGGGQDKSVILWDAESGKPLFSFSGHQSDVEAVAFFAGGSRIVSVGQDKTIKVWSIADRKEILSAVGFGEREYVVYTPSGCYSGSSGIANRLAVSYNNRPGPFNKDALFVPEGFGSLLAGR